MAVDAKVLRTRGTNRRVAKTKGVARCLKKPRKVVDHTTLTPWTDDDLRYSGTSGLVSAVPPEDAHALHSNGVVELDGFREGAWLPLDVAQQVYTKYVKSVIDGLEKRRADWTERKRTGFRDGTQVAHELSREFAHCGISIIATHSNWGPGGPRWYVGATDLLLAKLGDRSLPPPPPDLLRLLVPDASERQYMHVSEVGFTVAPPHSYPQQIHRDICRRRRSSIPLRRRMKTCRALHMLWKPRQLGPGARVTTNVYPGRWEASKNQKEWRPRKLNAKACVFDAEMFHHGAWTSSGWTASLTVQLLTRSGMNLVHDGLLSPQTLCYMAPVQSPVCVLNGGLWVDGGVESAAADNGGYLCSIEGEVGLRVVKPGDIRSRKKKKGPRGEAGGPEGGVAAAPGGEDAVLQVLDDEVQGMRGYAPAISCGLSYTPLNGADIDVLVVGSGVAATAAVAALGNSALRVSLLIPSLETQGTWGSPRCEAFYMQLTPSLQNVINSLPANESWQCAGPVSPHALLMYTLRAARMSVKTIGVADLCDAQPTPEGLLKVDYGDAIGSWRKSVRVGYVLYAGGDSEAISCAAKRMAATPNIAFAGAPAFLLGGRAWSAEDAEKRLQEGLWSGLVAAREIGKAARSLTGAEDSW